MRTIITGDIHGCSQTFKKLLSTICKLNTDEDRLIILGDAFDRGADSFGVFMELQRLEKAMGDRFIFLRGNHEKMMLEAHLSEENQNRWQRNGCQATIRSFREHGKEIDFCFPWFKDRPSGIDLGQYLCVHSELSSDRLDQNDEHTLVWERGLHQGWRCYNGRLGIGGHTSLKTPVYYAPDHSIVPLSYQTPGSLPSHGFITIDTGCVYAGTDEGNGCLTAMLIENGTYELRCLPCLTKDLPQAEE